MKQVSLTLASRDRADQIRRDNDQFNKCNDKAVEDRPEPNRPEPTPPAVGSTPIGDYYGLGHKTGFELGQKLGYTDAIEAVLKLMRNSSAYTSLSAFAVAVNKLKP